MPSRPRRVLAAVVLLTLCRLSPAYPWYGVTHIRMTDAVVRTLFDLPRFFRDGAAIVADCSSEPDLVASLKGTSLAERERPDHFINFEYVKGEHLPPLRSEYLRLVRQKAPGAMVGTLPYAIVEWADRLSLAFAEHRRWPDSRAVQYRCLVYAGILCHYCEDLWMPLHTTVHYDGRANDGVSPRTGIHDRMDGLIERLGLDLKKLANGREATGAWKPPDALFPAVIAEVELSNRQVERLYSLEKKLMEEAEDAEVKQLAAYCAQQAVDFTARMLRAAWKNSESIELPSWLSR